MVNPAVCATGVVDSAPRVTVHVVPETFVTAIISDGAFAQKLLDDGVKKAQREQSIVRHKE